MDKVRCMLSEYGLNQKLWVKAASTACYLINRSPNSSLEFKVPEEVWSGHKHSYYHLRPFGCVAYIHISQGKFNPRARKGIFLCYPNGVKGHRIWLIDEKNIVISKDIVFNEKVFFKTNSDSLTSPQLDQKISGHEQVQTIIANLKGITDQGRASEYDDQRQYMFQDHKSQGQFDDQYEDPVDNTGDSVTISW